jgi:hypothetical protein
VSRIDAGNQHGIQPHQGRIRTVISVGQGRDLALGEADVQVTLGFGAIPEPEGARPDLEAVAQTMILALVARRLDGAIVQPLEFGLELIRIQALSGIEFERTRPDARRQGPALALELAAHHAIEMDAIETHGHSGPDRQDQEPADENTPEPKACAFGRTSPAAHAGATIGSHG